ncbi:metal-dependent hydrolase [Chloroflexota bacterium]
MVEPSENSHFELYLLSLKRIVGKMLVFGHTGITLGAAALVASTLGSSRLSKTTRNKAVKSSPHYSQVVQNCKASWLTYLGSRIDIRLLLVGSILPDIIDKPIGQFFFRETFSNGRIFCHTLLFLILVTFAGIYLYGRYSKTWLIAFSFGTLTHLIFDQMWRTPRTLFWPLLGLTFEREDISNWILNIFHALFTNLGVYIPELVGAVIIIWFAWLLLCRGEIYSFIKYGQFQ